MNIGLIIIWIVMIPVMLYFSAIKPQKDEKKRQQELSDSMAIGDYCLTNGGMYGQIIDITTDMVIVEFGSKNCRIPMLKSSISRLEKPDALVSGASEPEKK